EVHFFRRGKVEITAVVVGFTDRPDDRQDRRAAAEKIDEFGAQDAGGTAGRDEYRDIGERERVVAVVAKALAQFSLAQRCGERLQERRPRGDGENPFWTAPLHRQASAVKRESTSSASSSASGVPTVSQCPSRVSPYSLPRSIALSK